jgi:Holliday junction resolvase RusA-like endonuclease
MYESSKRLKPWREIVAYTVMAARKGVQFAGPVRVLLSFDLRLNADLDKLCRGVLDGLTMSGAIVDDKQVVELHAEKRMRKPAGCRIRIEEMH